MNVFKYFNLYCVFCELFKVLFYLFLERFNVSHSYMLPSFQLSMRFGHFSENMEHFRVYRSHKIQHVFPLMIKLSMVE